MWLKFLISRYFWSNLLLAGIIIVVIGLVANFTLGIITKHGEEIKVPDLKGVPLKRAVEILEQKGLKYFIKDSVFSENAPKMSIVEQDPLADQNVKSNRIIYLTVNALDVPEVMIKMDQLHGSYREVKSYLEGLGFKIGEKIERKGSFDDVVIEVVVAGGRKINEDIELPRGSKINLVVEVTKLSKKSEETDEDEETVLLPDLNDLTLEEARTMLRRLELNIGSVIPKSKDTDTSNATIWKQKPSYKPNKTIEKGTEIDLYIK